MHPYFHLSRLSWCTFIFKKWFVSHCPFVPTIYLNLSDMICSFDYFFFFSNLIISYIKINRQITRVRSDTIKKRHNYKKTAITSLNHPTVDSSEVTRMHALYAELHRVFELHSSRLARRTPAGCCSCRTRSRHGPAAAHARRQSMRLRSSIRTIGVG
jgi:hypothetical protein